MHGIISFFHIVVTSLSNFLRTFLNGYCCVFWPDNRYFAHRSLVEIIFFCLFLVGWLLSTEKKAAVSVDFEQIALFSVDVDQTAVFYLVNVKVFKPKTLKTQNFEKSK